MSKTSKTQYVFGDFILEPSERRLLRLGSPVALETKAFDLLVLLIERSDNLVTKEEMLREIWQGAFVEESNIPLKIQAIRKTLGSEKETYIETVPKYGYRFCHEVTPLHLFEIDHTNEPDDRSPSSQAKPSSKSDALNKLSEGEKLLRRGKRKEGIEIILQGLDIAS